MLDKILSLCILDGYPLKTFAVALSSDDPDHSCLHPFSSEANHDDQEEDEVAGDEDQDWDMEEDQSRIAPRLEKTDRFSNFWVPLRLR